MKGAALEHVNLTVSNPEKTAAWLCELFGWKIRWQGPAIDGGMSIHVGTDDVPLGIFQGEALPGDLDVAPHPLHLHVHTGVGPVEQAAELLVLHDFRVDPSHFIP